MKHTKARIEAVVFAVLLIGTIFMLPGSSVQPTEKTLYNTPVQTEDMGPFILDRRYIIDPEPAPLNRDDNDDGGYKKDAGNELKRAIGIFPGEPIDETVGRGVYGKLSTTDVEDWYFFQVCDGQTISLTLTPPTGINYDLELYDVDGVLLASSTNTGDTIETISHVAGYIGEYNMRIFAPTPAAGRYQFSVVLLGQNDASTGNDAGDSFAAATTIATGVHHGYLDMNDNYDWYKFSATAGEGVHFLLEMEDTAYLSDFDINLYNPSGDLVYYDKYYYDDELYYPIDVSGDWRVEIEVYPGWVEMPQPTEWDYYTYGSGPYILTFAKESGVPAPPPPIPQPDITPIAKTYIVDNDFDSADDEYGYLAAIPAANYLEGGQRYLAPIIYTGDDTPTKYYDTEGDRGIVDDTTQYFIDDWEAYLADHAKSSVEYIIPADPVAAAAEIATDNWGSSDLAVIAIDGSGYEDTVKTLLSKSKTLRREVEVIEIDADSEEIVQTGSGAGYPMTIMPKWCAINVSMLGGGSATPSVNAIIPHFMTMGSDDWPSPYDAPGDKWDIWRPIDRAGIWTAGTDSIAGTWHFKITKYAGERYRVFVRNEDSVLTAKLTTDTPSDLQVFLVDPEGFVRAPDPPLWNGPVNPIHVWNGLENPAYNPWRTWDPEPATEQVAEVLHPIKGMWTVIVVPRYADGDDYKFSLTVESRTVNPDRADADISAANAAVIASLEHAPLLYVTDSEVPSATASALSTLGVDEVILVERGGGMANSVKSALPSAAADLTTMEDIVNYIKGLAGSEQYITFTSLKSAGFFAPAAEIAAFHGSPVLRIEDTPGNPASVSDRSETWRLWAADYYHGSRAPAHLPHATAPVEQNKLKILLTLIKYQLGQNVTLPEFGLDASRYWKEAVYKGIHDYIVELGLDEEGQEAYCFVAPRDDIYHIAPHVMMGNNSYAGSFPGMTVAYTAAHVARNVLYSAVIFGNPNRDVTTSQLMNFPDGGSATMNNGQSKQVYSSREVKKTFFSHFREYEGHCLWDAHLECINEGTSIMYYSGHGTGGSGISAQYLQTEHCNYPEQVWWDSWRGYSGYDNWRNARFNGQSWYNAEPPSLYDIIHYDHVDNLMENLHSTVVLYQSCSTGDAYGPFVYLDHGATLWYGNADSGICPPADLMDDEAYRDAFVYGEPLAQAYSHYIWLHFRDITTGDNMSMYGSSSMQISTIQVIFGDPGLVIYSPEWTSPVPVDA